MDLELNHKAPFKVMWWFQVDFTWRVKSLDNRDKEELRLWLERGKILATPTSCCGTLSKLIL